MWENTQSLVYLNSCRHLKVLFNSIRMCKMLIVFIKCHSSIFLYFKKENIAICILRAELCFIKWKCNAKNYLGRTYFKIQWFKHSSYYRNWFKFKWTKRCPKLWRKNMKRKSSSNCISNNNANSGKKEYPAVKLCGYKNLFPSMSRILIPYS